MIKIITFKYFFLIDRQNDKCNVAYYEENFNEKQETHALVLVITSLTITYFLLYNIALVL